ncbi:hypothetical protein [Orlajensenia flava]|nr:hypothetical protein [Glaciibacter flavus]
MTDVESPMTRTLTLASVVPVWLLAAVGAVVSGTVLAPSERFGGLALSLAICTLIAFCIQLATRRRDGFVDRVTLSIVGAVVVSAIGAIVIAITL